MWRLWQRKISDVKPWYSQYLCTPHGSVGFETRYCLSSWFVKGFDGMFWSVFSFIINCIWMYLGIIMIFSWLLIKIGMCYVCFINIELLWDVAILFRLLLVYFKLSKRKRSNFPLSLLIGFEKVKKKTNLLKIR